MLSRSHKNHDYRKRRIKKNKFRKYCHIPGHVVTGPSPKQKQVAGRVVANLISSKSYLTTGSDVMILRTPFEMVNTQHYKGTEMLSYTVTINYMYLF